MCYSGNCYFEDCPSGDCTLTFEDRSEFGYFCLDESVYRLEDRRTFKRKIKDYLKANYGENNLQSNYRRFMDRYFHVDCLIVEEKDLAPILKEQDNEEQGVSFLFKEDGYFVFEVDDEVYKVKKENLKENEYHCSKY